MVIKLHPYPPQAPSRTPRGPGAQLEAAGLGEPYFAKLGFHISMAG